MLLQILKKMTKFKEKYTENVSFGKRKCYIKNVFKIG